MAALCMGDNGSLDSEDLAERNTDPLLYDMVKKNGINHNCFLVEKKCDSLESAVSKHEKMTKINGCSVKPILPAFPKPSIPTLRSRKDKISPEIPKRKRRASKQDLSEPKEGSKETEEIKPLHPEFPTSSLKNGFPCPSVVIESKSAPCSTQVTPNASRSCTPNPSRSCTPNPFLAPSAITIPSNKDSQNCKHFKAKVEETPIKCNWKNCASMLESCNMLEHIRQCHVDPQQTSETFVCLWEGCKVFNKSSCSMSWLVRHIVCHSGDKPFKCIVANCGQRFTTQGGLERHVNSHFNTLPTANQKPMRPREDTPTKMMRRNKKHKRRRPQGNRTGDFFDNCIMARLHQELEDLTKHTRLDVHGPPHSVTFHSMVIAKRTEESGKVKVLLHWKPEDILPDIWVPESQAPDLSQKVIPMTQLPRDTAANLHPSLYRHHRFRKHRRK